jgi:hypothetical protein
MTELGRVVSQAVSCRIPNAEARVRAQVGLYRIYGGQSGAGSASLSTSVSLAIYLTDCSILIIIISLPGLVI